MKRDPDGSFSERGPATYLTEDPDECMELLDAPLPPRSTWFHGTSEAVARRACSVGLLPGCWLEEGCCAVLGYSSREEFLLRLEHLWIVEVEGRALEGDVKAWWVPRQAIVGAWFRDAFYSKADLAEATVAEIPLVDGCGCGLTGICRWQQAAWRRTLLPS